MLTLSVIKLIVAAIVVVGLSLLAEHSSPRVAGILSGYPTGSAISLFFFGLEVSPDFAADSAVYNMIGLFAVQTFIYLYYRASLKFNIFFNSLIAVAGFFVASWLLHFVELNKFIAVFIPILSIPLFIYLFHSIPNTKIENKVRLNYKTLFLRALFAASIILCVTGAAKWVGSTWSGLFSAFPATLFPLILIVHFTYGKNHVHTIIKNVPVGIFSLVLYSLSVSIVYPLYGIYWGTLISFAVATLYLVLYQIARKSGYFIEVNRA